MLRRWKKNIEYLFSLSANTGGTQSHNLEWNKSMSFPGVSLILYRENPRFSTFFGTYSVDPVSYFKESHYYSL